MLKANVEFNNEIASPLSPIEFLKQKVFKNAVLINWNKETKTAIFDVFSYHREGSLRIMTITLKNLEQI